MTLQHLLTLSPHDLDAMFWQLQERINATPKDDHATVTRLLAQQKGVYDVWMHKTAQKAP